MDVQPRLVRVVPVLYRPAMRQGVPARMMEVYPVVGLVFVSIAGQATVWSLAGAAVLLGLVHWVMCKLTNWDEHWPDTIRLTWQMPVRWRAEPLLRSPRAKVRSSYPRI